MIEVILLTSKEEIEKYRDDIVAFQQSQERLDVNSDFEHAMTVIENSKEIISPYFILGYTDGKLSGLFMGRIEEISINISLCYFKLFKLKRKGIVSIFGGLIESKSQEINEKLSKEYLNILYNSFKKFNIDLIHFHVLPMDSHLYFTLKKNKITSLCIQYNTQGHYQLELPPSLEMFYQKMNKNHRKNISYYSRKLNKNFNNIEVKCFKDESELNILLSDAEKIASKSYQRALGVGFIYDSLTEKRFSLAAQKKWLRCYILYIENKPVSFQMGFEYKGVYYMKGKGYDPNYKDYRVGTYLFIKMIEDFYTDNKIKCIDFGIGEAEYKEIYGEKKRVETDLLFFNYKLNNIFLYFILKTVRWCETFLKFILKKINILNKIKKALRQRKRESLSSKSI